MAEERCNMISINDIKVGEKYGFDLKARNGYASEYVEDVVDSIFTDCDGDHYISLKSPSPNSGLVQFAFSRLTRLVGPF